MRHTCRLLSVALLGLATSSAQEPKPRQPDLAKVDRKEAHGQWRFPNDKFVRIHGKVKVIDAHTLRYEDGTVVDLNGGMDAPDLAQQGLIDGKLYPAGEEAAAFLRKLIGDKPVTSYADPDEDAAKKKLTKVDAFVGEKGLIAMIQARQEQRSLERWLDEARQENARLREEARLLREDPRTIEDIARKELGLIKPGEQLFIVKDVPSTDAARQR